MAPKKKPVRHFQSTWSEAQDDQLLKAMNKVLGGVSKKKVPVEQWEQVAKLVTGKTAMQCSKHSLTKTFVRLARASKSDGPPKTKTAGRGRPPKTTSSTNGPIASDTE